MNEVYTISRDDPMPKPEILIKEFDNFASEVILTEHPYKLGKSVDSHRIDFKYGSVEANIVTESRLNGLFYHIGLESCQDYSVICQNTEVETQFKRIFMLTLVCFSEYPKVEVVLKPHMNHWRTKEEYEQPIQIEKRKKYFKNAFWKTDWEMPENLERLYKQFRSWASSVRMKIKRAEFEVQVGQFKDKLKGVCPHFSREELIQMIDETLTERVIGS